MSEKIESVEAPQIDREKVRDAIAEALGCTIYCCTRAWSAWGVGTMSQDDFVLASEDDGILDELTAAAISAIEARPESGRIVSKELIVRLREAAASRVASTAMIGADDLIAAADALESLGADRDSWERQAGDRLDDVLRVAAERDALAAEMKALREQAPVARIDDDENFQGPCRHAMAFVPMHRGAPLYARPVPARYITNEAIEEMAEDFLSTDGDEAPLVVGYVEFARAIEAALMGESDV